MIKWDRFTEKAQEAIELAQNSLKSLNQNQIWYHNVDALEFLFLFQLMEGQPDARRSNLLNPA